MADPDPTGYWRNLLPLLGVKAEHLDGKHGPCPCCGGKDRFRFDNLKGRGTWICSQCGNGDGYALLMRIKGWTFFETKLAVQEKLGSAAPDTPKRGNSSTWIQETMNSMWRAAHAIAPRSPAYLHLENRGLLMERYHDLRYLEACYYSEPGMKPSHHPAMLGMVRGADGKPVSLHRTYLDADGNKAKVPTPRKLMAGAMVRGGSAVRLAEVRTVMGIAEGIETALAAMIMSGVPTWAATNADRLMAFEPPAGIEEIYVYGDNDLSYTGQAAAYGLAKRMVARGIRVKVELPEAPDTDWNDVLLSTRKRR